MAGALGLLGSWWQSVRRKGRSSRHAATDPGDAVFAAQMAALDAALPRAVSVVGNAESLLARRHGAEIDARPTIRFNVARTQRAEAQGARWDFLATSHRDVLAHWQGAGAPYHTLLFTPYFDLHLPWIEGYAVTPVLTLPMRLSMALARELDARPTTGAQILWLLDALGREAHVFGFDWKVTPSQGQGGRKRDVHNHFRERQVMRGLIQRNGWTLHS